MNAEQVARLLGVSAKTVHRHIARGTIQATQKSRQELSIAEDQVEMLRQVLALDKPQYPSDLSQDMSRHLQELTERLTALEQEVAELRKGQSLPHEQAPSPSISTMPIDAIPQKEVPQNRATIAKKEVSGKRAYTRRKDTGLPEGCMLATDFAKAHGVEPRTFYDHMVLGLGPGTIPGEQGDPMLPVKEQLDYSERDKPGRKGERERYLTPAQQTATIAFWKRHGVVFTVPESEQEAPADESWWTEPGAE